MFNQVKKPSYLVAASIFLIMVGCKTTPRTAPLALSPVLSEAQLEVVDQSITSFAVRVSAMIDNPRDSVLEIESVGYTLSARGEKVREGTVDLPLIVPPSERASIEVPVAVEYSLAIEEHRQIFGGDAVPLVFNGIVRGSYDGEEVELPLDRAGRMRAPRLPKVSLDIPDGARRSPTEVHATFRLQVKNDNPFQVRIGALDYVLEVEDNELRQSRVGVSQRVPASGAYIFSIEQDLTSNNVPELEARMRDDNVIDYRLFGELRLGDLVVPFDETGEIRFAGGS